MNEYSIEKDSLIEKKESLIDKVSFTRQKHMMRTNTMISGSG